MRVARTARSPGRFIPTRAATSRGSRRCSARTSTCPARGLAPSSTLDHHHPRPPPPPSARPDPVASSSDVTPARDPADLGDDAFAAGDFPRAVECYDVALAASDDPPVFLSRGRALAALERWPAALRDADRAAARRGVWLAPRILRGACLESLGRWRRGAMLPRRLAPPRSSRNSRPRDVHTRRRRHRRGREAWK